MTHNDVTRLEPRLWDELKTIRVAVVVARYNAFITDRLLDGAISEARRRLGDRAKIVVVPVPGAFEIPVAVARAMDWRGEHDARFHAAVALGCIIKGETIHDEVIAHAVTRQLAVTAARSGRPVGLGVLTVNNTAQAEARAGGAAGNKGAEAMAAALETLAALHSLQLCGGT